MTDQSETKAIHRRRFLMAAGGASTMAVAAVAGPLSGEAQAQQQGGKPDPRRARYKESEHTKAFYRTNRY